jgi:hypothetical protein
MMRKNVEVGVDDQELRPPTGRCLPSTFLLLAVVFAPPGLVPLVLGRGAFSSLALSLALALAVSLAALGLGVVPIATGVAVVGICSVLVPATRALGWPTRKFWSELEDPVFASAEAVLRKSACRLWSFKCVRMARRVAAVPWPTGGGGASPEC